MWRCTAGIVGKVAFLSPYLLFVDNEEVAVFLSVDVVIHDHYEFGYLEVNVFGKGEGSEDAAAAPFAACLFRDHVVEVDDGLE